MKTKLEYFVAHAPCEPQWDFKVWMPTPVPEPRFASAIDDEAENREEIRSWYKEEIRQRYIQWPRVWAEAMIAEIGRERTES